MNYEVCSSSFNILFTKRKPSGHGSDVKCIDWHPHKGILASGSKDSQQPIILWDPKSGKKLATLYVYN